MNTIIYKQFEENDQKEVWITENLDGGHRVSAYKKDDAHIYENTDVDLRKWSDRRWLENYIKLLGTSEVYFGNLFDNYYRIERYKEVNSYRDLSFLNDLKITE